MSEKLKLRELKEREILNNAAKQFYLPSLSKRIFAAMKPDIALGRAVGADAGQIKMRLTVIILGSLLTAILSTLGWKYSEGGDNNEKMLIAVFSISWFIFISFIFLLFEATRLLHILFFLSILTLCSLVSDSYTSQHISGSGTNLVIATSISAGIVLLILAPSYIVGKKEEELYSLKNRQLEKEKEEKFMSLIKQQIKENLEKERKELENELKDSDISIRKEIAQAFITDMVERAKQGKLQAGGAQQQKKKQKQPQIALIPQTEEEEQ